MSNSPDWTDLVGKSAEEATACIKTERPEVTVIPVPEGAFQACDRIPNRLFLYVDEDNKVTRKPVIG